MTKNFPVIHYPIYFSCLLLILGCTRNISLSGQVTYSDDGSPVTNGVICFEGKTRVARGEIQADGSYGIGTFSRSDGIPEGEYGIYFFGVESEKPINGPIPTGKQEMLSSWGGKTRTPLIDEKYLSPKTSGLSIFVDGKTSKYNISLDRHEQK